jgi:hypothetical protein
MNYFEMFKQLTVNKDALRKAHQNELADVLYLIDETGTDDDIRDDLEMYANEAYDKIEKLFNLLESVKIELDCHNNHCDECANGRSDCGCMDGEVVEIRMDDEIKRNFFKEHKLEIFRSGCRYDWEYRIDNTLHLENDDDFKAKYGFEIEWD